MGCTFRDTLKITIADDTAMANSFIYDIPD